MPTDREAVPLGAADHDDLRAQWDTVLSGRSVLGEDLLHRWSEPHRVYHTTRHLAHVLQMLDRLAASSPRWVTQAEVRTVRLAVWFHDAVYVIGAPDNEEASAALAEQALTGQGRIRQDGDPSDEEVQEVARLVRLTTTHQPTEDDRLGALLCDADLAVLAGSPAQYAQYRRQVRAEYAAVPEPDFTAGRLQILRALREQPLFRTPAGQRLRIRAMANLDDEIALLRRG